MENVMIDFETMGNFSHAAVIQIGGCYFDEVTGEIGETFNMNVTLQSALDSGGSVNGDTIKWWLKQSDAARSVVIAPGINIKEAFNSFNKFLSNAKNIWSHATFDFVILTETLRRLKIDPLFHYRAARDIRTLLKLSPVDLNTLTREGIHHCALDDCFFQVKYCVIALNNLRN